MWPRLHLSRSLKVKFRSYFSLNVTNFVYLTRFVYLILMLGALLVGLTNSKYDTLSIRPASLEKISTSKKFKISPSYGYAKAWWKSSWIHNRKMRVLLWNHARDWEIHKETTGNSNAFTVNSQVGNRNSQEKSENSLMCSISHFTFHICSQLVYPDLWIHRWIRVGMSCELDSPFCTVLYTTYTYNLMIYVNRVFVLFYKTNTSHFPNVEITFPYRDTLYILEIHYIYPI